MKRIEYFRKEVYGNTLEYIVNQGDAQIVQQLTKQKTINSVTRELIRDLSNGYILFVEVIQPR